ncbi:MAG: tRNA (adenosine(37)-N6)-threonylcarbamoyltransferase complex transferase subunit TsaD [Candidatus Pacebacteria bacterium]|nr:tRNA (adenosine(37)-N6)-threonylcarbamoyltransferase complex transferase subunit TsaD [Candidatus Paceibacterota bacterium]
MIILGIETSCDDTCCALLKKQGNFEVLSNIISSQIMTHKPYQGIFPALAKREHEKNLTLVLKNALKKAHLLEKKQNKTKDLSNILSRHPVLLKKLSIFLKKYKKPKIDAIAITQGPGLEPCLWTGINFVKALAFSWNIPIIPVNHLKSHIYVNLLQKKILFPALALIVSGGHTQLILMKDKNNFKLLGETRDDAAGECFDKTARLLKLDYPGGPEIAKKAKSVMESSIKLPRPMINSKNYDFSFSGLKTAVLYETKKRKLNKKIVQELCFEIQQSIIDVLLKKTIKASRDFKVKSIVLGGGVIANEELRKQFKKKINIPLVLPANNLCTDNALMTCLAASCNLRQKDWKKLKANANLKIHG